MLITIRALEYASRYVQALIMQMESLTLVHLIALVTIALNRVCCIASAHRHGLIGRLIDASLDALGMIIQRFQPIPKMFEAVV